MSVPLSCLWVIWLAIIRSGGGSTTTNRHEVAAFDFATVSGCDQLVVGPTHSRGETLDLLITDVPDVAWVVVVAQIGNSDHSYLSVVISMAQEVQTYVWVRNSWSIKSIVCGAIRIYPGVTFVLLTILLRFWMNICPGWLDVIYQPRPSVCVARKTLVWWSCKAGMLLASSRRLIFGEPVIALGLTVKRLSAIKWELMKPTLRQIVSLVTETGMFLWMFIPLISGGPLLSLRF